MSAQRIHLGAIVLRDGALLFVRPPSGDRWELPGGPLPLESEDADEEMESVLMRLGISAPAIDEDFLETVHLADAAGHIIYNLYCPGANWSGEPTAPLRGALAWFAPHELEAVALDPGLRAAILAALGLTTRADPAEAILRAVTGSDATRVAFPDRRSAGLDVLRTLSGADPSAEAELRSACPELTDAILDFSMGEIWQGEALDRRTRSLLVVAMLAAAGQHASLKSHIGGALNHGASAEAIIETLKMVAVYAGFPAAVAAWPVMEEVFAQRQIPRPAVAP